MSVEEEKAASARSETSSVASGKRSNCSSSKGRRERRKRNQLGRKNTLVDEDVIMHESIENEDEDKHQCKKVVHFDD
jgi:hypothetical protein